MKSAFHVATQNHYNAWDSWYKQLQKHWNLATDPGEETCVTGGDIDTCAAKDRKTLKFPERLKLFLDHNGYRF